MSEFPSEQTNDKYDAYFQKTGIKLTNTEKPSDLVSRIAQKILSSYRKEEIIQEGGYTCTVKAHGLTLRPKISIYKPYKCLFRLRIEPAAHIAATKCFRNWRTW